MPNNLSNGDAEPLKPMTSLTGVERMPILMGIGEGDR